jgi:hypothetical protein
MSKELDLIRSSLDRDRRTLDLIKYSIYLNKNRLAWKMYSSRMPPVDFKSFLAERKRNTSFNKKHMEWLEEHNNWIISKRLEELKGTYQSKPNFWISFLKEMGIVIILLIIYYSIV